MAALTAARDTKRLGEAYPPGRLLLKVAGAVKIFQGALVAIKADGFATPGATATGLIAIGRADETVDNSGGADGAKSVHVTPGVYKWANFGGDAVTQAEVGNECFITDDQTVSKTNGMGTKSAAGTVVQVDSDGVVVAHPYPAKHVA